MTKEERKKAVENLEFSAKLGIIPSNEAFKLAIEALKQEPCEDAVSRQAVLDATVKKNSIWNAITNASGENLEEIINSLPSVTPAREHGEWIRVDDTKCKCSKCEITHFIAQYPHGKIDFCPNCGADMRKEQNNG